MNVQDLINELLKLPPDLPVAIYNEKAGGWSLVTKVEVEPTDLFTHQEIPTVRITDY